MRRCVCNALSASIVNAEVVLLRGWRTVSGVGCMVRGRVRVGVGACLVISTLRLSQDFPSHSLLRYSADLLRCLSPAATISWSATHLMVDLATPAFSLTMPCSCVRLPLRTWSWPTRSDMGDMAMVRRLHASLKQSDEPVTFGDGAARRLLRLNPVVPGECAGSKE